MIQSERECRMADSVMKMDSLGVPERVVDAGYRVLVDAVAGLPLQWVMAISTLKPYLASVYVAMLEADDPVNGQPS